jgi:hypothetical protein
MTRELYFPVLDCFVRGLPHLYRDVDAPAGSIVSLMIAGDCGGVWLLVRGSSGWSFVRDGEPVARVMIPQELAWRLFTKGIDRHIARQQVEIDGDRRLGEKILQLTAIVG